MFLYKFCNRVVLKMHRSSHEHSEVYDNWKPGPKHVMTEGYSYRDADVKEESFLEYINQLVMTGEVAGLFPKEEMDAMVNDVRPVFKRECPGKTALCEKSHLGMSL